MKNLYSLILVLCMAGMVQAQVNVDNFESGSLQWDNVACGGGIVDNSLKTGINLSDHALYAYRLR